MRNIHFLAINLFSTHIAPEGTDVSPITLFLAGITHKYIQLYKKSSLEDPDFQLTMRVYTLERAIRIMIKMFVSVVNWM